MKIKIKNYFESKLNGEERLTCAHENPAPKLVSVEIDGIMYHAVAYKNWNGELDIAYKEVMLDDYDYDGSQRSFYVWDIVDDKLEEAEWVIFAIPSEKAEKREQFLKLAQEQYEGDTEMKNYRVYWGEWKNGGFSWDIFTEEVDTLEEAIQVGLRNYNEKDKHNAAIAYKVNEAGEDVELVFERTPNFNAKQEFEDAFIDALKSLAPSYDAEEDMTYSDNPHPSYHSTMASYLDLATEESAYKAGRAKAKEVAEDIERMCAEEKAMKAEEEEDCGF